MFRVIVASCLLAVCCGAVVPGGKIQGGSANDIKNVPYLVNLETNTGLHFGGGVIVSKRCVLTAGHFSSFSFGTQIRYGSSFLAGSKDDDEGTVVAVSNFILHPKYNSSNVDYDIAILKLEKAIKFSDTAQPIEIAENEACEGAMGLVSGWGLDSNMENHVQVKSVKVPIHARDDCSEKVKRYKTTITPRKFCAGGVGGNPCGYDNGDPLVIDGKLYGIVSEIPQCYYAPAIYTNLLQFEIRQFILNRCKV